MFSLGFLFSSCFANEIDLKAWQRRNEKMCFTLEYVNRKKKYIYSQCDIWDIECGAEFSFFLQSFPLPVGKCM